MSKKRTSAESNDDEQTNTDSDSVFRQEDNVKRAKFTSWSDTTLQDLPIELLECILIKAVAMEVKGMKLAKSVWKEKADRVISRLTIVCSQWNSTLTTNFFRNELHRTLDGTAQETIRLEMLHQIPIQFRVLHVTTMKDEIFMLCKQGEQEYIVVYDSNSAADVKDVIALPGMRAVEIAGCGTSNCVYVLNEESHCLSVLRMTKDEELQFNISPWISDLSLPLCTISVSSSGTLMILSKQLLSGEVASRERRPNPTIVRLHNANGSLQHKIVLSPDIFSIRYVFDGIQKSNGNLVLASCPDSKLLLTEIDTTGRILRQYQSAFWGDSASFSEMYGRILISDRFSGMELLDSELNPLDFMDQTQNEGLFVSPSQLHCNKERNEIMRVCFLKGTWTRVLTIFHFT